MQLENLLFRYLPEKLIQYTEQQGGKEAEEKVKGENMAEENMTEQRMVEEGANGWQDAEEFPQGGGLEALKKWEPGMDVEKALGFCGGNEAFYMELLRDFASDNRQELLTKYYEEKDWKNYTAMVHALKGVARTLGFVNLGDVSEILQKAAEAEDEGTILEKHSQMMEKYLHILYGIRRM
ncbi:MAG: Hpt domain-containing protein [Roseburia sp.]